ncbi:unnamed protein product [Moneuplotes crassus]|uniref:Uncharacterized protein n=1 Tax=Euplotes crassus TaxID=5936 RepID=A0AAD1XVJ1_EUPCR|nr:unnamed protein product [Moneuplotes crassus]
MNEEDGMEFFKKYNNFYKKEESSSNNQDTEPIQNLDIGLEFKEFLQHKSSKAKKKIEVKCENHCNCANCKNYKMMRVNNQRNCKNDLDFYHHNNHHAMFGMNYENNCSAAHEMIVNNNLSKYNSPTPPPALSSCRCNHCLMMMKDSNMGCHNVCCNFSPHTISTQFSPNESNPRGGGCQQLANHPHVAHTRGHSGMTFSKGSIPRYSNMSQNTQKSQKSKDENIIMRLSRIQSYFMSSQECCKFCNKKNNYGNLIQSNLNSKYLTGMDYYNVKVVNDIIYNDTTNLVSVFKDYLIYDDISEFLKRIYTKDECEERLIKIYTFYDKYSKVFPNYIILEENRYMFKNIERKQIAIDERQRFFQELEEKEKKKATKKEDSSSILFKEYSEMMFDSKFIESVKNLKTNSLITDSFPFQVVSRMLDSQTCSGEGSRVVRLDGTGEINKKEVVKRLEDYDLGELVEKFLVKDNSISDSSCQEAPKEMVKPGKENKETKKKLNVKPFLKNQVFSYKEVQKKVKKDYLNTERTNRVEKPLAQNYMVMHRKNVNSNDGRVKQKEKGYNEPKLDKKAIYSQARKQNKRPKSSSSHGPVKKMNTKKPMLFSTVDKRPPTAFMTQKFSWKDINGIPMKIIASPTGSPRKLSKNKQTYEHGTENNLRHKVKPSKQPVSMKHKNELQSKALRQHPPQIKSEVAEYHKKESKKAYCKSDRNKFKISQDKVSKTKDSHLNIVDTHTLNSAREVAGNLTDRSANTLKWTFKSKDGDKTTSNKNIEDFEKLFYQSVATDKGKIISQKGVDFNQIKSFKVQHHPSSYRSVSKNSKNTKHMKNKKSFKLYDSKSKKSKRVSPAGSKYKYRNSSKPVKNKCSTEESSRYSGYVKSFGQKKGSMNQSQSKSKIIPQTARYPSSGMEKYFKFKQSQVSNATEQSKHVKKVKSLKNLKSSCNHGVPHSKSKKAARGPSPMAPSKAPKQGIPGVKQIHIKPMSYRETTRYPSQTSISTSTSAKNQMIKPMITTHEVQNPELLKKISTYYKRPYKY